MRPGLILVVFAFLCPSARAQKPEPKFEGKPLAYWVERLQKAETKEDRNRSAQAIVTFGPDSAAAVPALMEMLNDLSDDYRKLVSEIMCMIGPGAKDAVPELVKRLKERQTRKLLYETENSNINEMKNLIQILASIGPDAKNAVPALIATLTQTDSDVRDLAVLALCCIGPDAREAIPAIQRVVKARIGVLEKRSEGQPLYFSTLETWNSDAFPYELHKIGPDVLPLLLELLDERGVHGKGFAMREIAKLGPAAIKAAPKLAALLRNDHPNIRFHTAVVLWKIEKNPAVVPTLAKLLIEPVETPIPSRAAQMLGELGPDAVEAIPALREAATVGFVVWIFQSNRYLGYHYWGRNLSAEECKQVSRSRAYIELGDAARQALDRILPESKPKE